MMVAHGGARGKVSMGEGYGSYRVNHEVAGVTKEMTER